MRGKIRNLHSRLAEQQVPRSAVAALVVMLLASPAALAIGHSLNVDSQGRWIHHETRAYTTCNEITSSGLHDQARYAADSWENLTNGVLTFPAKADCHPAGQDARDIQLQDGSYGDTGWRASSLADSGSPNNASYLATHTHIKFNLSQIPASYPGAAKKALACREIGLVVGVDRVYSGAWASHNQGVGQNYNDCMSFLGDPATQNSDDQSTNNYTYRNVIGPHTIDLVTDKYKLNGVPTTISGSLSTAANAGSPLTGPTYDMTIAGTGAGATSQGIASIDVKVDGVSQGTLPTWTCSTAQLPCSHSRTYTFVTKDWTTGSHTVKAIVTDQGGLTTEKTLGVVISQPDATITQGPSAGGSTNAPSFSFSEPHGITRFECHTDVQAQWSSCASPVTPSFTSQGTHTFWVRALDKSGAPESSPASRQFVFDTVKPHTVVTSAPSDGTTSSGSVAFHANETATYECNFDDDVWAACQSPTNLTGLSSGYHDFEIRSRDAAGNLESPPVYADWTTTPTTTPGGDPDPEDDPEDPDDGTTIDGESFAPAWDAAPADELEATDAISPATTADSYEDGFSVGDGDYEVSFEPLSVDPGADDADLTAPDVAKYDDTAPSVDTTVRTSVVGLEAQQHIDSASAPTSFTWQVNLQPDQSLSTLSDGSIAVMQAYPTEPVDPVDPPIVPIPDDPFDVGDDSPEPGAPLAADTRQQYEDAQDDAIDVVEDGGQPPVALVTKPVAVDAAQNPIASTLAVSGTNKIVMTVDHRASGVTYPVKAQPTVEYTGAFDANLDCAQAFADAPTGWKRWCTQGTGAEAQDDDLSTVGDPATSFDDYLADQPAEVQDALSGIDSSSDPVVDLASRVDYTDVDTLNSHEIAFCVYHPVLCHDWERQKEYAYQSAGYTFTGDRLSGDGTRGNMFQHALWVESMINDHPKARKPAFRLAAFHEWSDKQDKYQFNDAQHDDARRKSQMDMINDQFGFVRAKVWRVRDHKKKWFCEDMLDYTPGGYFVGVHKDPYAPSVRSFLENFPPAILYRRKHDRNHVVVHENGNRCPR